MEKPTVLISGPSISCDEQLLSEIKQIACVYKNTQNHKIESILKKTRVDILLLELLKNNKSGIEIIKKIKKEFPMIQVVLINGNGDRNVIAKGFEEGIKDAFRVPYHRGLITERVSAILGMKSLIISQN